MLFISSINSSESSEGKLLAEALRRFCRSIELCDDYLRGYYGLKMVGLMSKKSWQDNVIDANVADIGSPALNDFQRLEEHWMAYGNCRDH